MTVTRQQYLVVFGATTLGVCLLVATPPAEARTQAGRAAESAAEPARILWSVCTPSKTKAVAAAKPVSRPVTRAVAPLRRSVLPRLNCSWSRELRLQAIAARSGGSGMSGDASDDEAPICSDGNSCGPAPGQAPGTVSSLEIIKAVVTSVLREPPRFVDSDRAPRRLGGVAPGYPQPLFEPPRAWQSPA